MLRLHHRVTAGTTGVLLATGWYALGTIVAFGVATLTLVSVSPLGGSIHTVRAVPSPIPLQTARALVPVPLAYVGLGMTRVYLTALPALFLIAGPIGATLSDRGGNVVATGAGIAAALTLTVVTGCPCGSGTATPLVLKPL